jgi:hypothetical protein
VDVKPESILDIGLGNGKLGFIARELIDVMYGERYRSEQWQLKLDGIEVFGDYIQAHQQAIYNNIYIGDALSVIDSLENYDLVVLGDVLEHFPKEKGWKMLDKCFFHSAKAVALFLPLGEGWHQETIYGNEYERHRSCWHQYEFDTMSKYFHIQEYKTIGYYGAFLVYKQAYIENRMEALKSTAFFGDSGQNRQ